MKLPRIDLKYAYETGDFNITEWMLIFGLSALFGFVVCYIVHFIYINI